MTTYYVSSISGSDKNAGTSSSAPLASLQAAENVVKPGDTVEVMNGTYTGPAGGNVLTISTSGTASAPITFEAAPGATPVINSSGSWQGIEIDASYITINGLTVVGDAANYNLASATAGYGTGNADLDGNGIAATSGKLIHNIIIENNTVYNEPGGGIGIGDGDYLQILNNNVHDNAHWSAFGDSGISIAGSQNFDNGPAPHIIIEGNTSINNSELVPEYRAGAITDGEGIILDSNDGYTGGFLVENNTTSGNSGPGIEAFFSDNALITGNTTTGDLTNPVSVSEGEILINQSTGDTVTNNVTSAAPPPPPAGQLATNGSFETHDFGGWTVGGNSALVSDGPQIFIDSDPESGAYAAGMGSEGSDGTLSQTIATTAGQTYTLSFWLQNEASGTNDFKALWNGQTLVSLTNASQSGYTQYTYTVTATGSSSTLEFSAMNDQSLWNIDNVSLVPSSSSGTGSSSGSPPAAPTIPYGVVNSNDSVTLTGTAPGGSTVTVSDGGAKPLGTTTANSAFVWSFTTPDLSAGSYAFTATDTTSAGTSAVSKALDVTVANAPSSSSSSSSASNLVANDSFETDSLSGWTVGGNSAVVSAGPQLSVDAKPESGSYAAAFGSMGSDGTLSQTIATTPGGTYTLSFWLENDAAGANDFKALWNGQTLLSLSNASQSGYTEYTYGVTATGSSSTLEFSARNDPSQWDLDNVSLVDPPSSSSGTGSSSGSPPAAPTIPYGVVNSNDSVTLTGTAPGGSTVTVSDGGAKPLGTTTANSAFVWSFTTPDLSAGSYAFTATDTTSAGTSAVSKALDVTVANAPSSSSSSSSASNLVANDSFETDSLSGWTVGGNSAVVSAGPQLSVDAKPESGSYAAAFGSMGSDGTLSQTIATTPGGTYTLSFWLENDAAGANDFKALWNGQTLLSLSNASQSGYTEHTYGVTATGSSSTLEFSARNDPGQWDLDNVSLGRR